jgi:hypothetical protein
VRQPRPCPWGILLPPRVQEAPPLAQKNTQSPRQPYKARLPILRIHRHPLRESLRPPPFVGQACARAMQRRTSRVGQRCTHP